MGIEKIDMGYIQQQEKKFTTHLNHVLQGLRDPISLGLWAYLSSLPPNWLINKKQLRDHFGLGRDKLANCIKYLKENGLISINQEKLENGKFSRVQILIRCGYDFKKDKKTSRKNRLLKNRVPVHRTPAKRHLYNK